MVTVLEVLVLTVAAGTSLRLGSRLTAGAGTAGAVVHDADNHLLVNPPGGLLKGQADLVLLGAEVKLLLLACCLAKVAKWAPSAVTKNCSKQRRQKLNSRNVSNVEAFGMDAA